MDTSRGRRLTELAQAAYKKENEKEKLSQYEQGPAESPCPPDARYEKEEAGLMLHRFSNDMSKYCDKSPAQELTSERDGVEAPLNKNVKQHQARSYEQQSSPAGARRKLDFSLHNCLLDQPETLLSAELLAAASDGNNNLPLCSESHKNLPSIDHMSTEQLSDVLATEPTIQQALPSPQSITNKLTLM